MNPYKIGAYLLAVTVLLAAVFGAGHNSGRKAEAKSHAPAHAKLKDAYDKAHTGLLNAGAALREVAAKAQQDAARAAQKQAQGAQAVAEAKEAQRATQGRVAALERQLKAERSTCTEAEMRICGVPLR